MQWDTDELQLRAGSQRVQGGGPRYFSCPGNNNNSHNGAGNECSRAIRLAKPARSCHCRGLSHSGGAWYRKRRMWRTRNDIKRVAGVWGDAIQGGAVLGVVG